MLHRLAAQTARFLGVIALWAALPAYADNIPGSPGTVVPELTETATDLQVRSIKDNMRPLREPGGVDVTVSTSGTVEGLGFGVGGDSPLALRFDYRSMGDSPGETRDFLGVDADIAAAIDTLLAARPAIKRVVLWGLCDAASAALLYLEATRDPRVAGLS